MNEQIYMYVSFRYSFIPTILLLIGYLYGCKIYGFVIRFSDSFQFSANWLNRGKITIRLVASIFMTIFNDFYNLNMTCFYVYSKRLDIISQQIKHI